MIRGHPAYAEAALEHGAAAAAIEQVHLPCGIDRLLDRVDDKTCDAVIDDFGNRPAAKRDHRHATRQRLDHDKTEWLRPVDRKEQRHGASEEIALLLLIDLADELDQRVAQQMPNLPLEVSAIGWIHLGRDFQRQVAPGCNRDRAIDALLRGDAAEEGQYLPRSDETAGDRPAIHDKRCQSSLRREAARAGRSRSR